MDGFTNRLMDGQTVQQTNAWWGWWQGGWLGVQVGKPASIQTGKQVQALKM